MLANNQEKRRERWQEREAGTACQRAPFRMTSVSFRLSLVLGLAIYGKMICDVQSPTATKLETIYSTNKHPQNIAQNYQYRTIDQPTSAALNQNIKQEIRHILLERFHYVFQDADQIESVEPETSMTVDASEFLSAKSPAILESQPMLLDNEPANSETNKQKGLEIEPSESSSPSETHMRFFRVANRVFSRVDLPEPYRARASPPGKASTCVQHLGCIEDIPNFPTILRGSNVTSSFTMYTPSSAEKWHRGYRLNYEPLVHYQLADASTSIEELSQRLRKAQASLASTESTPLRRLSVTSAWPRRQLESTASSWRSAAKIVHSREFPFDLATLERSGFDPRLNTRIIVGGYFAKDDEEWIAEIVRQWLRLEPCNVIKVGWADSNRGLYHTAAYNSRIVARQLTLFLYYLDQLFHLDSGKVHIVGHSLGAHIAGFVGADFEGHLARITGLDPAGPLFVELNTSLRLDPSDARFVDVIHTNGGSITKGALGLSIPSGHVDYYGNGGSLQPGCLFTSVTQSIIDPVERVACSHRRSYRYFTEILKLAIAEQAWIPSPAQPEFAIVDEDNEFQDSYVPSNELPEGWRNQASSAVQVKPMQECTANATICSRRKLVRSSRRAGVRKRQARAVTRYPRAFLFEVGKPEDLSRISQPELFMLNCELAPCNRSGIDMAPSFKRIEFHMMKPDFPRGKRGLYFFRTRTEAPFFASKQYALVVRTSLPIRRKMSLLARIGQQIVVETDLDEFQAHHIFPFVPNDGRLVDLRDKFRIPQLWMMWRSRSFNLLIASQSNELVLQSIELVGLDDQAEATMSRSNSSYSLGNGSEQFASSPQIVKYIATISSPNSSTATPVTPGTSEFPGTGNDKTLDGNANQGSANTTIPLERPLLLNRNQWHKFEGFIQRLTRSS